MSVSTKVRPEPDDPVQATGALKRHLQAGVAVLLIGLGTLVGWAFGVTLQGAVIASGQFVVASEVKKVQHPTGGIVAAIMTREGASVREGDLLLRLDDTAIRASVQVLSRELFEYAVRSARLTAERDEQASFAPIDPPDLILAQADRGLSSLPKHGCLRPGQDSARGSARSSLHVSNKRARKERVSSSRLRIARSNARLSSGSSRTFALCIVKGWSRFPA